MTKFELLKMILEMEVPSVGFNSLKDKNELETYFPEVYNLIGKTQNPLHHPEGDAYNHTMMVVDKVAKATTDIITRFCALAHDFGKGETPKFMLPRHFNHDKRGVEIINRMNWLPNDWKDPAAFVAKSHMLAYSKLRESTIAKFLEGIFYSHIGFDEYVEIIRADGGDELPWFLDVELYKDVIEVEENEKKLINQIEIVKKFKTDKNII